MIPKRSAPHLMRSGCRFPACAKPLASFIVWLDASAGGALEQCLVFRRGLSALNPPRGIAAGSTRRLAKYIQAIEIVDSFATITAGNGGYWEDRSHDWYAGS